MQMILLAKPISAAEASAAGLIADIYEPGTVLDKAVETASTLAGMSPMALSLAKESICRCMCCFPRSLPSPVAHVSCRISIRPALHHATRVPAERCRMLIDLTQPTISDAMTSLSVACTTMPLVPTTRRRVSELFSRRGAPAGLAECDHNRHVDICSAATSSQIVNDITCFVSAVSIDRRGKPLPRHIGALASRVSSV